MNKKKSDRITLYLFGLLVVLSSGRVIVDMVRQTYTDSMFSFVLSIICAAAWIAVFLVTWRKYRAKEDKS